MKDKAYKGVSLWIEQIEASYLLERVGICTLPILLKYPIWIKRDLAYHYLYHCC